MVTLFQKQVKCLTTNLFILRRKHSLCQVNQERLTLLDLVTWYQCANFNTNFKKKTFATNLHSANPLPIGIINSKTLEGDSTNFEVA